MGENQEFPYFLQGTVVKGYQRGTKDLGVPTANLDGEDIKNLKLIDGIYYGWAKIVDANESHAFMMCASIGKNPTYGNENRSCEIHLLEKIEESLYGKKLKCIFAGFVRGQTKFHCLPDLVKAIENDITYSKKELEKEQYFNLKIHEYLN